MTTIQNKWNENVNYGHSLRITFNCAVNRELFTDCVDYVYNFKIPNEASTHIFYIFDKYIYVFYEETSENKEPLKDKLINHLRAGKMKLSKSEYDVSDDYLDEMEGIGGFDDWLRELLSKSDDQVYTKSNILSKDYIYEFNKCNRNMIGRVKIEKQIEQVKTEIDALVAEDAKMDHEVLELDKSIEETNKILKELDEVKDKYTQLLEQSKLKRKLIKAKKEVDSKLKDEEISKTQEVERVKKAAIISAIEELFRFTPLQQNNGRLTHNYVSKKVICDLLLLDCKSQKDIRYLSNILKDYGVVYDRFKTIDKVKGSFQFLKLK
jgi:hypothetical protein